MNTPHVLSLNSGLRTRPSGGGSPTAIDKKPVGSFEMCDPGPKHGGLGSGVVGDEIDKPQHHGGALQTVYAYAREDLDHWERQLGRPISPGGFGEDVTSVGVDTTHALVGELWRIDDVVLRVEVPRIPCATFAAHMGVPRWVRRFADEGRTGAYRSVVTPGRVRTGAAISVERPDHDVDLLLLFRGLMGDLEAAHRVLDANVAHPEVHRSLTDIVARRGG